MLITILQYICTYYIYLSGPFPPVIIYVRKVHLCIVECAPSVLLIHFLLKYYVHVYTVRVCECIAWMNEFDCRSLSRYGGHGDMDPAALQRLYETQVSGVMKVNYIPRLYAIFHTYIRTCILYIIHDTYTNMK